MQTSTTHSSFDQYCISHKTISHRPAAAPGLWSSPWVLHDLLSSFAPPRNKSWRRHSEHYKIKLRHLTPYWNSKIHSKFSWEKQK